MQPTYTEIKKASLSALKNRWPEAIVASATIVSVALLDTLMQLILMSIFKVDAVWSPFSPTIIPIYNIIASICITIFSAIFSFAVAFPLFFGIMRWFWLITGGSNPSLKEMFVFFSESKLFGKSVLISIGLFLRLIIASVVCFLPCVICRILITPEFYNALGYAMPIWLESLHPLVDILRMIGIIIFVLWTTRYILFYTVLFSEPNLSAHKTLVATKKITNGGIIRFIGFAFSFIGWGLLCLFMVPLIFVIPYLLSAFSIYGREEYRSKTNF